MPRIAAGDRAALRQLYQATSAKLFGVCLRILSNRDESEDVLQEVYITIWRRADRFEAGRASVMTWISTIARNRAIDRLRARGPLAYAEQVEELEIDDGRRAPTRCWRPPRMARRWASACRSWTNARKR